MTDILDSDSSMILQVFRILTEQIERQNEIIRELISKLDQPEKSSTFSDFAPLVQTIGQLLSQQQQGNIQPDEDSDV